MKKIFTLIAVALLATVGAQAQTVISWEDSWSKNNIQTTTSGYKLQITGNTSKTLDKGGTIAIDGTDYTAIKLSNGAQNTLTAPEGTTIKKVTIYSYMNITYNKMKERDNGTPYIRDAYWKEVNGVSYDGSVLMKSCNLSSDDLATVENASNYVGTDQPDKYEFTLDAPVNSMTFTNTGEQVAFVLVIETGTPAGISNATADKAVNEDAPVFNLAGQRVSKDYKGVVIQDGKKRINK